MAKVSQGHWRLLPTTVLAVSGSKGHRKSPVRAFSTFSDGKLWSPPADFTPSAIPPDSQPEAPLRSSSKLRTAANVNSLEKAFLACNKSDAFSARDFCGLAGCP